jgi:hypothetical protein
MAGCRKEIVNVNEGKSICIRARESTVLRVQAQFERNRFAA